MPSISANKANETFNLLLKDIQPAESTLKLYKEILNRTAMKQLDNLNSRLSTLRNALSLLDEESSIAMRRWNKGEMDTEDKDEIINRVEADRFEKKDQIESLEAQQAVKKSQIDYAMNFMHDAYKLWLGADVDIRQKFQKAIFPEGGSLN